MFKSIDEYQKKYFKVVFRANKFDYGYYSQCNDQEYINGNSVIINKGDEFLVSSIMLLLNEITTVKRIQIPSELIQVPISNEMVALIKYVATNSQINNQVNYRLVTEHNFTAFLEVSNKLQVQEYGDLYKLEFNDVYLKQQDYQLYAIEYQDIIVGEFMYIPSLKSIESIMLLDQYRNQGIGKTVLELFSKLENTEIYLSADDSSIGFYEKIGAQIVDKKQVVNLYGNSRNLIGYLSMIDY